MKSLLLIALLGADIFTQIEQNNLRLSEQTKQLEQLVTTPPEQEQRNLFIPPWHRDIGGFSGRRFSCLNAPVGEHRARCAVMAAHELELQICEKLDLQLPLYPQKPFIFVRSGEPRFCIVNDTEIWITAETADDFYQQLEQAVRQLVQEHSRI